MSDKLLLFVSLDIVSRKRNFLLYYYSLFSEKD